MNKEKLESAKNLFFIALGIDIAVTGMVVISDFWGAGILKDVSAGIATVDQSTISRMEFWDSFAKVMILTLIGVGLGLVKWLNTCYQYAKESVGALGFKNDGWTATGWIIPIFNLFKPYQVINEIYKAGAPTYAIPDGWKKESGSGLLLTWWIFYAVTHFIGWIVGKQLLKSALRDDMTLQQSIGMIEFHAWFCVMSLVIAGLWFAVAGGLTRRLLERSRINGKSLVPVRTEPVSSLMPSINSPTQVATVAAHERTNSQVTPMNIPVSFDPIDEDTIYTIVAEELDTGKTDKGLWTRLFAECGGDEKQVKVLYINRRAEKLLKSEKARVEQLAFEEAHRQRQLALDAEKAEQIRRQKAGLADSRLIAAVVDGNWSSAAQLLEGGVSPFGATDDGIKLAALAIKRGDQQMVNLLRSHEIKSMEPQVVAVVDKFHAGTDLSIDEVTSLVDASAKHADFVMMRSASTGYTLLHWCGRLGLDKSVDVLLDRGANAAAFCDAGKQAHHLTRSTALANRLAAAVNAVP